MSGIGPRSAQMLDFAEAYAAEDDLIDVARRVADEFGLTPISPATGAALSLLTAAGSAKAVVEIGTGTGVSGLWLLRGLRAGRCAHHDRRGGRTSAGGEADLPRSRVRARRVPG